jgi:gamma-glutamyltranspeptidase/glutathione hydrolase
MGGILACPQPEAVEAGRRILQDGGNAIDAAIATAFAQGIADPIMTSIGGNGTMQGPPPRDSRDVERLGRSSVTS